MDLPLEQLSKLQKQRAPPRVTQKAALPLKKVKKNSQTKLAKGEVSNDRPINPFRIRASKQHQATADPRFWATDNSQAKRTYDEGYEFLRDLRDKELADLQAKLKNHRAAKLSHDEVAALKKEISQRVSEKARAKRRSEKPKTHSS